MKTHNVLSGVFFLVIVMVITSCGTSVNIAKRQFNGGYYVHVHKNKSIAGKTKDAVSENAYSATLAQTEIAADNTPVLKETKNPEAEPVADINFEATPSQSEDKTSESHIADERNVLLVDAAPVQHNVSVKKIKREIKREIKRNVEQLKGGSVPGILLVILCIFIPPVAVLIVDDVNKPFWIDLILWILGFGGGIGVNSFAFIFWLIAIIYAFTICF